MKLGVPVYEGVNLLDVAGPWEMFRWVAPKFGLETVLVSHDGNGVTTMNGVQIGVHADFAATSALDVLWVPGGAPAALERIMANPAHPYLKYLQTVAASAQWVCSVCEGALLLARAGLLDGHKATTHWAFVKCLKRFPKIDVDDTNPRFIVSDNRLTGGGISSGLDEALQLIVLLFGQDAAIDVQVTTQYFPAPPVSGVIPPAGHCPVRW